MEQRGLDLVKVDKIIYLYFFSARVEFVPWANKLASQKMHFIPRSY